jgi:hypothetical protein
MKLSCMLMVAAVAVVALSSTQAEAKVWSHAAAEDSHAKTTLSAKAGTKSQDAVSRAKKVLAAKQAHKREAAARATEKKAAIEVNPDRISLHSISTAQHKLHGLVAI